MTDSVGNTNALDADDGVDVEREPEELGDELVGDEGDEGAGEGAASADADAAGGENPGGEGAGLETAADASAEVPEASVDAGEAAGGAGETKLTALREEFNELNDRHLRLAAEFTNYRRRSESERLESWSRAQADLVAKFLDVLDDLHRVAQLDLSNATVEAIMEGVDLVERKFVRMLEDSGVEVHEPATGTAFDPERMEAMMRVPAEAEEADETVAQVFQKGYSLKGILVRPARVSVFKHG